MKYTINDFYFVLSLLFFNVYSIQMLAVSSLLSAVAVVIVGQNANCINSSCGIYIQSTCV